MPHEVCAARAYGVCDMKVVIREFPFLWSLT